MPYTAPHTITTGELVTVDTMNDEWGGNASFLANPPACRVRASAGFSHNSSGTWLPVTFDTELFDTDSMHSTVTNTSRITCNTAGLYSVGASFEFAFNATGNRGLGIFLNGTTDVAFSYGPPAVTPIGTGLNANGIVKMAVGNYIEVRAFQSSGGTLAVTTSTTSLPALWAVWVGLG